MTEARRAAVLVVAGLLEGIRRQAYRGPWLLMAAIVPAGRLVRARPLATAPDGPAALRAAMEFGALLSDLSPIALALAAAVHFHPGMGARVAAAFFEGSERRHRRRYTSRFSVN